MKITTAWLRVLLLSGACGALAACGGDSKSSNPEGEGGDSATGGSSSGGRSSGGRSGGGGTPSGEAGAAGDGATGTTGGGSNSGGSAGGSSTGGTSSGGAGTGGAGTGGAGTGGTPSGVCADYCEQALAAGCDSPANEGECMTGCNLVTNIDACAQEVETALVCQSTAATSCDSDGSVAFAGCEVEEVAVLVCLENAPPPEELEQPCADYCAAVAQADCPNDDPAACVSECGMVGVLTPACTQVWAAYVTCASTDTFTCNADGEAEPEGCGTEALAAVACILTGLGS